MKKLSTLILILFLTAFINLSFAQIDTPYQHYKEFSKADSNKLFLRFENLNFVKNNEYNGEFSDGATWIGYVATPKLVYYPSSNFRIEAGVRLQKYSGREDFTETEAIFSAIYKPSDKMEFIMGSLNQDNNHDLSEPMFEPERYFMNTAENGFQFLYKSKKLQFQTWIDWEQFILENDPFQERFTFGLSGDWKLNTSDKYSLSIPMEAILTHRGGEIDSSDGSVQTVGNYASGLAFKKQVEGSRITSWYAKAMAYYFVDNSSEKEFMFDKGHAIYPQVGFTTKKSKLNFGYWNGYHFASSRGSKLFQSVAIDTPGYFENRRELATLNYYHEHKVANGIHFGGKLDVYYDLKNSKENFAAAIYLRINGDFFLKKVKWNK
ncbi:hypothetical protein [Marinifilum caeruleilacunae]|uniref:Porin n=1 Tax=Marinifilum caeruleilacunae TaxID=2499076 RepID=A0ABX1WZV1_9BACT|nr:hypothetical protein [Marinifilum caeruleilacunae]NOU61693.1 hypothetical protein [Marinifilum caeruleilacunae]